MLVGLSVKTSDSLSLSISIFSPRTHPWPLGLVPVIVCISLPSIIARIMISNRSFITCLLFCHYWESMKWLQRISAISAKYRGSREIRSSEVLQYTHFQGSRWTERPTNGPFSHQWVISWWRTYVAGHLSYFLLTEGWYFAALKAANSGPTILRYRYLWGGL